MPKVSPEHFKKRRAEILDAARRVFTQKGFEPTTMQDVVKESGMSRGGVYQYFSSTEDMFIAIREDVYEQFTLYLDELLMNHENVWDALMAYVEGYIGENETDNYKFGLVSYEYSVVAWRNDKHRKVISEQSKKATRLMAHFLDEGVKRGEFSPLYPLEAIALFIFNVTDGLILHHMIADATQNVYIKEQIAGLLDYLKQALRINVQSKP